MSEKIMTEKTTVSLEDGKQQLDLLMQSINKHQREHLLSYAVQTWMTLKIGDNDSDLDRDSHNEDDDFVDDPVATLNAIVEEIRARVPLDAILPSENIKPPNKGKNADCDPNVTMHVDGFLYNDDDVEDLVKEGKLQRYYCRDCRSRNVEPFIFISHSTSREELYHVFNTLLPTLDGKVVLDVGSRLGAALYGAYVYTDAAKIIGVEMNKDLCDLQNKIIHKFKMNKRIEVINKRIEDAAELLRTADVVLLNNVFEFYLSEEEQTNTWRFLKENIKKGAYIVSRPSVSTSLSNLNTGVDVDGWLQRMEILEKSNNLFDLEPTDQDDFSDIFCYTVL